MVQFALGSVHPTRSVADGQGQIEASRPLICDEPFYGKTNCRSQPAGDWCATPADRQQAGSYRGSKPGHKKAAI